MEATQTTTANGNPAKLHSASVTTLRKLLSEAVQQALTPENVGEKNLFGEHITIGDVAESYESIARYAYKIADIVRTGDYLVS